MKSSLRNWSSIGLGLAFAFALGFAGWSLAGTAAEDTGSDRGSSQKPAESKKVGGRAELAKFMRAKLDASSKVLDGLCTENFDLIIAGASKLKEMSTAEQWRFSTDVMYRQHSAEFRGTVDDLLAAARKKNLDGAALAWTRSTLSCIECHRWVRGTIISEQ